MLDKAWAYSDETALCLEVSINTLNLWREIGYLKYGTHWRKLESKKQNDNEIVYHINWCMEEMEYWKSHHANIQGLLA
tara:strand:- start:350 stop:583 length:234 start_codon:yes stop_codon:yes gene_type:complete